MNKVQKVNPEEPQEIQVPAPRYIARRMKKDVRAYIRTDFPMVCLEYTGENWESVVQYCPPGEKLEWMEEAMIESGYEPIVPYVSSPEKRFEMEVREGYTPGYRIWATYKGRGTKTWTDCGYEYDIEWDIDILWEDRPSQRRQKRYITKLCEDVTRAGGFCECGDFKGLSETARKWKMCERCASHEESKSQAKQADPLYDLRQKAKFSYRRDVEQDPGTIFDQMTEDQLKVAIEEHDKSFNGWLDWWSVMCR